MPSYSSRRQFLRHLGLSAAAFPFICNLPSLGFESSRGRKQRLVIMFSPNGIVPKTFWPEEAGDLIAFKESLRPLEPFRNQTLTLHGISDKIRGDGDGHMRGIGCLLTGIELFPGNIQGGSDTPAGWASGPSIDQELKNFLQSDPCTKTRFGSLEFGVAVPERADTWTRLVYAAANKPIAPIHDPYQMFNKMYGQAKDREDLKSVLDDLQADFVKVAAQLSAEDRRLLDEHANFVRQMETELQQAEEASQSHAMPALEEGVVNDNDNIPQLSEMQIELLVNSFAADFTRIATLQYTNSVGVARMKWLDIDEAHHTLSHEPDTNEDAQAKLTKINHWYCTQLAYLAKRLAETPEPGGEGSLLDNTMIVWTNELGKGNNHSHDNTPFVLVGGGLNLKMGRALKFNNEPHNRLLLSFAHEMGHPLERFGNPDHCESGPLSLT